MVRLRFERGAAASLRVRAGRRQKGSRGLRSRRSEVVQRPPHELLDVARNAAASAFRAAERKRLLEGITCPAAARAAVDVFLHARALLGADFLFEIAGEKRD